MFGLNLTIFVTERVILSAEIHVPRMEAEVAILGIELEKATSSFLVLGVFLCEWNRLNYTVNVTATFITFQSCAK